MFLKAEEECYSKDGKFTNVFALTLRTVKECFYYNDRNGIFQI